MDDNNLAETGIEEIERKQRQMDFELLLPRLCRMPYLKKKL